MKKPLTILLLSLFFMHSCNKQPSMDDIVRQNVEAYLKPNLNDPQSYEFLELRLIDSVLYKDNIQFRKKMFQDLIADSEKEIESQIKYKDDKVFASLYNEERVIENENKIIRNKTILMKIDSIEKQMGSQVNEVASYTYGYRIRANNKMGAKVINEYYLQTKPAPSYEVLNLASDSGKMYSAPNGFPGYEEILTTE